MSTLIELDSRSRASLRAIATHGRYLADVEGDGTIILTPAVVITAAEASLMARPDILARVASNRAEGYPGQRGRPERHRR
ncbi:MAG: hypothetical protein FWD74_03275 [Actinomycetia bacterium]|nr:hypothetical protein [Actinomycetes bacterium]